MSAPSVLIAGCGDVGSRLAKQLLAAGWEVHGLRRDVSKLPDGVIGVAGDLFNEDCPATWPVGAVDYLVYCAAATDHDEAGYRAAYVQGLQNVLSWLDDYGQVPERLVFVSSSSVYGQQGGEWVDETSATIAAGYSGRLMLEAEQVALNSGIPASILRLTGIYGPGREWLLTQVRRGYRVEVEPPLYGNRIHADDAAGLLAFLLEKDRQGLKLDDFYIGVDDAPAPLAEVVGWLREYLGVTEWADDASVRRTGSKRCSNARVKALGWRPTYPSYREGYAALKVNAESQTPQNNCRSEPARDEAITFNTCADCYTVIASRLTPTGDVCVFRGGLLLFEQPLALTGCELRLFIRQRGIHCLENFQLFALAHKDPVIALTVLLQPHAVVAIAHRRAVARQAQSITVGSRQTGDLAVRLELHGAAFTLTVGDFPVTAQIRRIQRTFETGTDRCAFRHRNLCTVENLLGFVLAGGLLQLPAVAFQLTGGAAIEVDFPGAGFLTQQPSFDVLKTVGVAGLTGLGVDVPLKVRAVSLKRFAQGAALGCGIDRHLVDPGAADVTVGRVAGAAAEENGEQRES